MKKKTANYMQNKDISIPFIDLSAQQNRLCDKINDSISTVLTHGKYIMGPEVNKLEEKLKIYTNSDFVITCASGTDALLLALMAKGIGKGDIVFCPAFTFPATAEVIALLGATPYFVDVDPKNFNICTKHLLKSIELVRKEKKYQIKSIIAVDLYGHPADYKKLNEIAKNYNMTLISDAAQSFGAEYYGQKVGTLADITCVSFFPAKPLGCYGDGGAIFTNCPQIAEKIKSLRVHGKGKSKYDIDFVGLNSRLDTIQAAILLVKLENFNWELQRRNEIAEIYSNEFRAYIDIPEVPKNIKSVWAQYTLKHKNRDKLISDLKSQGIPSMVYYPIPMHLQKAYKKFYRGPNINSELLSSQVFSLPMYPDMSKNIQEYIIKNLIKFL